MANQKGYLYNYDRNNWLSGATFGTASAATITPTNSFTEGGLTYDPNGNIRKLQRSNQAGTTVDQLNYNYSYTGKNRLNSLTENAAVTTNAGDIENQAPDNYIYDAIGQLLTNVQEDIHYVYNTQGLVTEVQVGPNQISVKFYYNERGQRIKKETYFIIDDTPSLLSTDYYIPDLSGNVMAIYNRRNAGGISTPIIQKELPIFGLSRLGVYNKEDNSSSYQITDHLGNVRAVIKKINGSPVIQSYADYYPFGEQLPERNSTSGYRYGFQGQEKDPETGMEAFQLRLWDGRIGRWLSPDPYGQYSSPYLGMGNNPIGLVDPDGGQTIDPPVNKKPIELDAVIITGSSKSSWGSYFNDFSKQMAVFGANYFGTIATNNITFGLKQLPHAFTGTNFEAAERFGRLGGDITTMVQGLGEDVLAAGGEVLSLGIATVPAGAVAIHGSALALGSGYATAVEIKGLADYFAKAGHSSSGGGSGGGFKKLKSNNDANNYAQSKGYKDAHDLKASHVGKGNESKFDIEINRVSGEGRIISKDGKIIVPIH
ncbi:MAG TPA: RHS repeat-associated core domain-containing protein [Flavobacterium sp.]|jgi:RHS repeat-associated protein